MVNQNESFTGSAHSFCEDYPVKTPLKTIEDYLSSLPVPIRETLQALRATIKSVVPEMEERLSSGAPFFWYRGRRAVGFGVAKTHLSFYIMHGDVLKTHSKDLADYDTSRTVIRFTQEKPLPTELVQKLVRARLEEIELRPT